jgi:Alginate lyase
MPRHDGIEDGADSMTDKGGLPAGPVSPLPAHPPTRRRSWLRSTAVIAVIAVLIAGLGVAVASQRSERTAIPSRSGAATTGQVTSSGTSSQPSPAGLDGSGTPSLNESRGYLADRSDLIKRAALARTGTEPYAAAFADLLAWADGAVRRDPRPVKSLRIGGTEGPFVDDTAAAYGLALAHAVTGERRYGEAAARYIMAWVDKTTATRGTCKRDGACQTSLIISRTVPGFVFAADLLAGTGILDDARLERFRAWLRDVMLPTASELDNNWGDAGTFTRIVLTDYLGDQDGFEAALKKWRELLDLVKPDGHIPAEVKREEGGLGYTQEALDYKVAVAMIAERRGVDLWGYQGAGGGSLKGAVDYLARYMQDPRSWPWHSDVRRWGSSAFWELAYSHWQDPDYTALVLERRPHGSTGHSAVRWTTLSNGLPIDGG